MFMAVLFIIAKTGSNQDVHQQEMDKRWHIHTMESVLFSEKKKWTIKPQKDTKTLKCILLRERRQSEKDTYFIIHYLSLWKTTETQKTIETVERSVVTGVGGKGGRMKHKGFLKIYLFLVALGLRCCVQAFSSCGERGLLFVVVPGFLIAMASLVAEHGL